MCKKIEPSSIWARVSYFGCETHIFQLFKTKRWHSPKLFSWKASSLLISNNPFHVVLLCYMSTTDSTSFYFQSVTKVKQSYGRIPFSQFCSPVWQILNIFNWTVDYKILLNQQDLARSLYNQESVVEKVPDI